MGECSSSSHVGVWRCRGFVLWVEEERGVGVGRLMVRCSSSSCSRGYSASSQTTSSGDNVSVRIHGLEDVHYFTFVLVI